MPEDSLATKSDIAALHQRLERIEQQLESLIGKPLRQNKTTADASSDRFIQLFIHNFETAARHSSQAEKILAHDHLLSNRLSRLWTKHNVDLNPLPSVTLNAAVSAVIYEVYKKIGGNTDSTDVEPKLEEETKQ